MPTRLLLFCALILSSSSLGFAQSTLDTIGVTALLTADPTLTGSGVIVTQIESAPSPLQFEVNPGSPGDENAPGFFSYRSTSGRSETFPNRVGSESGHADTVAQNFYGSGIGVAPGVRHVENYETRFFYPCVIVSQVETTSPVFNQSFEFGGHNAGQDQTYDDYIARYHTIVASGIGDGGPVDSPSDCYNGLGVAAYGGASSTGPSADGRCKPDITAPAGATSFSAPLVSGAAAILVQAGRRQGVNASLAVDSRTVKAILLTGAVKPSGWSHTSTRPLDPNYGAGILNVYNSYEELLGGRHSPTHTGYSRSGHPPLTTGTSIAASRGWDYHAVTATPSDAGVNHYLLQTSTSGALIATMVWNKGYRLSAINRMDLFLYDSSGNLLGSSVSQVDNVQHLYVTGLNPGTYDLEVFKPAGPVGAPGIVSERGGYALAWDFGR